MAGTDIYYISGKAKKTAIGWGAYVPNDLTADSDPDFDNWGPDSYWSCEAFAQWHQLNKQKYGQQVANSKFIAAYEIAFSFGSYHQTCCYNSNFRNYCIANGLDIDTLFCAILMPVVNTTTNVLNSVENVSEGAYSTTKLIGKAMPFIAVGAGIWAIDKFVYPIFPKQ